jgi:nucleoside-diphosphate-sugar epimerase
MNPHPGYREGGRAMRIGVTGATGFLGRYIVSELAEQGHQCRCWYRPASDRSGFEGLEDAIDWVEGDLGNTDDALRLVEGCESVVHAALFHPGGGFRGGEGDLPQFVEMNVVGTIRLIEAARAAGVSRFVFISTCAVHEKILDDRPLDETHPLWPASHYGAHKAAIEAFVHSYGFGQGFPICALRPTGIYGLAHPPNRSKWFDLIRAVAQGKDVDCRRGGKEVHAADVARSVGLLLKAKTESITGEAFNCYDRYISEFEVATIARDLSGSHCEVRGTQPTPRNQIITTRLRSLGMQFGGTPLLGKTIEDLIEASRRS